MAKLSRPTPGSPQSCAWISYVVGLPFKVPEPSRTALEHPLASEAKVRDVTLRHLNFVFVADSFTVHVPVVPLLSVLALRSNETCLLVGDAIVPLPVTLPEYWYSYAELAAGTPPGHRPTKKETATQATIAAPRRFLTERRTGRFVRSAEITVPS